MGYAVGWWDFVEIGDEQQMICRDSDERVVMVGDLDGPWSSKAIAEHPKRPNDRWMRFEYRHEEFWFPLIVNWVPEEGRILVDYNLSSELWRIETNADTEYPPYGGWVRVDDMVPDAFWCWPGVLKGYLPRTQKQAQNKDWYNGITMSAGFLNGHWKIDKVSWEALAPSLKFQKLGHWNALTHDLYEGKPTLEAACLAAWETQELQKKGNIEQHFSNISKSCFHLKRKFWSDIGAPPVTWNFIGDGEINDHKAAPSIGTNIFEMIKHDSVWASTDDVFRSRFIVEEIGALEMIFGVISNQSESIEIQNNRFRRVAVIHPTFSTDIPPPYAPATSKKINQYTIDLVSEWIWDGYFEPYSKGEKFEACFVLVDFLGGCFHNGRSRFTSFSGGIENGIN